MKKFISVTVVTVLLFALSISVASADGPPYGPRDLSGANLPPGVGNGIYDVSNFGKCVMHGTQVDQSSWLPLELGPHTLIVNPAQTIGHTAPGLEGPNTPFEDLAFCGNA